MREENYFEKKLEIARENLAYTKSQLEHFDIQIKQLTEVYNYNLENYNDKVTQLQQIKSNLEKQIPDLEKKLEQGFKYIHQKSGKGYKSYLDWHKADLKEKAEEAEKNFIELQRKHELKKRKKELPRPVAEAPTGEVIESQPEREIRLLQEKFEALENQRKELLQKQKTEKELIKAAKELEKEEEAEIIPEIPNALGPIDETAPYKEVEGVLTLHSDWVQEYADEEGGKAIWQGKITKGFRNWCAEKGYKLIE